mmetsp:Transcript_17704/g.41137  ORF Transcript_17704/g.41137 Transcript_17704/m.41137 type:complete len:247 (+) Transcript_17704:73-813(+)
MDPESGVPSPGGNAGALVATGGASDSLVQQVLRAIVSRLRGVFGSLMPKQQVGVENRFYYDEVEKVWKLQNETEQDRAEAEVMRFHTSRGMSSSIAPPTTACDPTRGEFAAAPPPPPPTGGPVTKSIHAGDHNDAAAAAASLIHPVYAPHGLVGSQASASQQSYGAPPAARPQPLQSQAPPPRTNPFSSSPSSTPLTSPFGASNVAPLPSPSPSPLANPFGGVQGGTPLATPFQGSGQLAPQGQWS